MRVKGGEDWKGKGKGEDESPIQRNYRCRIKFTISATFNHNQLFNIIYRSLLSISLTGTLPKFAEELELILAVW